MTTVLDASALIAFIRNEPGTGIVRAVLDDAAMSIVNWAEVLTKMAEYGTHPTEVASGLSRGLVLDHGLTILPLTRTQAADAAVLRFVTNRRGLSLGDRVCLALARSLDAPVLTTDRAWATLDLPIEVRVIR